MIVKSIHNEIVHVELLTRQGVVVARVKWSDGSLVELKLGEGCSNTLAGEHRRPLTLEELANADD